MKSRLIIALIAILSTLAGAAENAGDAVECANLIYGGTKSSVCFSEEFLSTVASGHVQHVGQVTTAM